MQKYACLHFHHAKCVCITSKICSIEGILMPQLATRYWKSAFVRVISSSSSVAFVGEFLSLQFVLC